MNITMRDKKEQDDSEDWSNVKPLPAPVTLEAKLNSLFKKYHFLIVEQENDVRRLRVGGNETEACALEKRNIEELKEFRIKATQHIIKLVGDSQS